MVYMIMDLLDMYSIYIYKYMYIYTDTQVYLPTQEMPKPPSTNARVFHFDFTLTLAEAGHWPLVTTLRNLPIQLTHHNEFTSIASLRCISEIMDKENSCTPLKTNMEPQKRRLGR